MINHVNYGNRGNIGWIEGNTFFSHRNSKTHFFRNYNGFGQSIEVLAFLQKKEIEYIVLIIDRFRTIKAKVLDFYENGERYSDNGDKQLILPIKYFQEFKQIEEKQEKLVYPTNSNSNNSLQGKLSKYHHHY